MQEKIKELRGQLIGLFGSSEGLERLMVSPWLALPEPAEKGEGNWPLGCASTKEEIMKTIDGALQWCVEHGVTVHFIPVDTTFAFPEAVDVRTSEPYDSESLGCGKTFLEAVQAAATFLPGREYTDGQTG